MPYITPIEPGSLNNRSNLMQSRLWGLTKGKLGKHPLAFRTHWKGQRDILLLFTNHAADNVVHAYVPWTPAFFVPEDQRSTFLERLSAVHGQTATYLYGASSSRKRHLMPTYRLQWHAIRLARASLCSRYDLFGISPDNIPSHPMHGLYTFKTGFGNYTLQRQGCWDYPFRKREYTVYAGKEAAAGGYHLRQTFRGSLSFPSI